MAAYDPPLNNNSLARKVGTGRQTIMNILNAKGVRNSPYLKLISDKLGGDAPLFEPPTTDELQARILDGLAKLDGKQREAVAGVIDALLARAEKSEKS